MATSVTLPSLGEGIESGDVLSVLVAEGDVITADQDILEIETDKATMPVPSPAAGKVTKVLVSEGDTVSVGASILEVDAAAEAVDDSSSNAAAQESKSEDAAAQAPAPQDEAPAEVATEPEPASEQAEPEETAPPAAPSKAATSKSPAPRSKPTASAAKLPKVGGETPGDGRSAAAASPSVRRLARQLGVDLRRVRPSGEGGRVTAEDVTEYVRTSNQRVTSKAVNDAQLPGEPDTDDWGPIRRERMSRLRQTIARNMFESYSTIPQLTNFDDADITELEQLRKESKDDYAANDIKLTTMPFLIKAVASSLRRHPVVNASIDVETNEVLYKEYVSVGIAVDTERGLVVPVIRDADQMNIPQIAAELARIAEVARDGKYSIDDLRGGTFTISNLGAIGGTYSTPIINPPEVAILLAGRSRMLPSYVDGELQPRLMMPLSLTYDHRIVDGAAAARFLNEIKGYLSAPGRLLLAP